MINLQLNMLGLARLSIRVLLQAGQFFPILMTSVTPLSFPYGILAYSSADITTRITPAIGMFSSP
jgi:hypothetical protein